MIKKIMVVILRATLLPVIFFIGALMYRISTLKLKIKNYMNKEKGLTIKQILDGVKDGSITIDNKKHNLVSFGNIDNVVKHFKENVIESLEERIKRYSVEKDDISDSYSKYKKAILETPIEFGKFVTESSSDIHCWDCTSGGGLYVVLSDKNTLTLLSSKEYFKIGEVNGDKYSYALKPTDVLPECEASQLNITDKLICEINVPSGDLIFANFFKDDRLYKLKKEGYHSINSIIGRVELMNDLASRDVGYAQMGNMSCDVFLRKDGKEIIIGTTFGYNAETDEEIEHEFNGYKNLGNISLSVWRWMCADKKILNAHNEEIPKDMKPNSHEDEDYKDYVWAKVKPGRWVIEHYYDVVGDRPDGIYSKLYLKEDEAV